MAFSRFTAICFACALVAAGGESSASSPRFKTLVIMDPDNLMLPVTHSLFFRDLAVRGHKLTYARADDTGLALTSYGEYLYDNLIMFSPKTEDFGGSVDVAAIVEFVDSGRNLLLVATPDSSDSIRELAAECGIALVDEERAYVQDHFAHDAAMDEGNHTIVASEDFAAPDVVLGKERPGPVLFRGAGLAVAGANPLVLPILRAASTAYSMLARGRVTAGPAILLVAALQARNHARVVVAGSGELFSDWFAMARVTYPSVLFTAGGGPAAGGRESGNRAFTREVAMWGFQEKGMLRVDSVVYKATGGPDQPRAVRVGQEVEYRIAVSELVGGGEWRGYVTDTLQLEMVRLDPYIRTGLKPDGHGGFHAAFRVPDVYGVYHFKVLHRRGGYSVLESKQEVVVRPLKQAEHERFLPSAYPYYVSAFSMMAATLLFSVLFLYHDPPATDKKDK